MFVIHMLALICFALALGSVVNILTVEEFRKTFATDKNLAKSLALRWTVLVVAGTGFALIAHWPF